MDVYCKECKSEYRKAFRRNPNRKIIPGTRRYPETPEQREIRHKKARERYARRRMNGGKYTVQDVQQQYERQRGRCYYCKKKLGKTRGEYHVDHIVPVTRGGNDDPDNIVVTCPTCNLRKNDKLPHEWPEGGHLL